MKWTTELEERVKDGSLRREALDLVSLGVFAFAVALLWAIAVTT